MSVKNSFFINLRLTISLILLLPFLPVIAQDSVLLLNGELLQGKITADQGEYYRFEWKRKQKIHEIGIEKSDIFSVILQGQAEKVIYKIDTSLGNDFTPEEMRDFWEGESFARKQYKTRWSLIGGGLVGTLSPFYGFWGLALSPIYLGAVAIHKPEPPEEAPLPPRVRDVRFYNLGYGNTARRMKVQRAALTTLGGVVVIWIISVATGGLK